MRQEDHFRPLFVFHLSFDICWWTLTWTYNKCKLYRISDCWFRDILNFDFLWKDLGLASPPHSVYNLWRKIFFILYCINWLNFNFWFPLLLEMLGTMCIVITCCLACDVIDFGINHSFLIQPFFYITVKSGQKYKYFTNERKF